MQKRFMKQVQFFFGKTKINIVPKDQLHHGATIGSTNFKQESMQERSMNGF